MTDPQHTLQECLSKVIDAIRLDPNSAFAVKAKKDLYRVLGGVPDNYTPNFPLRDSYPVFVDE